MLTGEYEHDKAELERLIAHEEAVISKADKMVIVATVSMRRYRLMLTALKTGKQK